MWRSICAHFLSSKAAPRRRSTVPNPLTPALSSPRPPASRYPSPLCFAPPHYPPSRNVFRMRGKRTDVISGRGRPLRFRSPGCPSSNETPCPPRIALCHLASLKETDGAKSVAHANPLATFGALRDPCGIAGVPSLGRSDCSKSLDGDCGTNAERRCGQH